MEHQVTTIEAGGILATTPIESLKASIAEANERRALLEQYVASNMKADSDYHEIKGKKSLGKSGAEKICALFGVTIGISEHAKDLYENLPEAVKQSGVLIMRTSLLKNGEYIGSGIGGRNLKDDGGDLNKSLKMARKSSIIDAVISTFGLSGIFTQDIENMPSAAIQTRPAASSAPRPVVTEKSSGKLTFTVNDVTNRKAKTGNNYLVLKTDQGDLFYFGSGTFVRGESYSGKTETVNSGYGSFTKLISIDTNQEELYDNESEENDAPGF